MTKLEKLGQNIRKIRSEDTDLSQEKLAEHAGLHRNFIGQLERGEVNVSFTNLVSIAKALNVRIVDLLRGID